MAEPGVAEALLRERLPRSLVEDLVGAPEALPEHFIDESLRASIVDQVLRMRMRGGKVTYVYCLIEHKRTHEALVLVQILHYVAMLYKRLAKKKRRSERLPPVVALLVYNGEPRWRGPRRFSDLVGNHPALKRFCVDFEVILVDVGAESPEKLSSNRLLKGGLLALKSAAVPPRRQATVIRQVIKALEDDPSTLRTFIGYVGEVAGKSGRPLIEQAMKNVDQEDTMQTINQYLKSLGRRSGVRVGLKKGLEKGREQGREEALRQLLGRVLKKRFKKVPPEVDERLAKADAATLEAWHDAAIDARSLRAIFSKPH